jgi:hypothetical protein
MGADYSAAGNDRELSPFALPEDFVQGPNREATDTLNLEPFDKTQGRPLNFEHVPGGPRNEFLSGA